jgi:chromatin remodeling complex protein RSC6
MTVRRKKKTKSKNTTETKQTPKPVSKNIKSTTNTHATSVVSTKTATKTKPKPKSTPALQVVSLDTVVKTTPPTLSESFAAVVNQLAPLRSQLTTITSQVRALQKRVDRELKQAHKSGKKRAKRTGNRAPTGFVKPTQISAELAGFLGKPKGSEMARTAVTREINGYIREHKLQDPLNGRRILADAKLSKLLKLTSTDELTYFNLQRYMSPHFAKKGTVFTCA